MSPEFSKYDPFSEDSEKMRKDNKSDLRITKMPNKFIPNSDNIGDKDESKDFVDNRKTVQPLIVNNSKPKNEKIIGDPSDDEEEEKIIMTKHEETKTKSNKDKPKSSELSTDDNSIDTQEPDNYVYRTSDYEGGRDTQMKRLMADLLAQANINDRFRSTEITDDFTEPSGSIYTSQSKGSTGGYLEALGVEKNSKVYKLIMKFKKAITKRIKMYRNKAMVVGEMVSTEK